MLKKRIINGGIAARLLAAITSEFGIVADQLRLPVTTSVYACPAGGGGGGGCQHNPALRLTF